MGRKPLGNQVWKKHMLAQAVEIEPVKKADMRSARVMRLRMVDTGKW